jgi:hypothetical protein
LHDIPSEDEAFGKLGPLKELWYESLYSAILDTNQHFKDNCDHRSDLPPLFSWHVRSKFQTLLEPHTNAYNFAIVPVPGGSFLVTHRFFACKFRKAFNGKLPPPTNKTQLRYYNANSGLSIWPTLPGWEQLRTFPSGGTVNLLVYYDPDPQHELAWVKIACPRFATLNEVECLWDKPIDNPLFSGSGGFEVKHSTEEREDLPFEELPFEEDDDNPLTGLAE